jgi:WD40 repeat protein
MTERQDSDTTGDQIEAARKARLRTGAVVRVGDITESTGVAIGTGAVASVTTIAPDLVHDVSALAGNLNPYLGLGPFTYDLRERYAGREAQVADAVEKLIAPGAQRTMLFVLGASGSGKSSFAQAGLLPALEAHYRERGRGVRRAILRPGRRPLAALADALEWLGEPFRALLDPPTILRDPTAIAAAVSRLTPNGRVNLLVVDQFEELFTQAEPAERDALLALMTTLPPFTDLRTHIVATMRSDYLGDLFARRALYDAATKEGIALRQLDEADLRTAIVQPLHACQREDPRYAHKAWEPGLVARLARQAAPSATYLPLLQLTLTELWRRGRLTLAAYDEDRPGGLGGNLASAVEARAAAVLEYVDYDRAPPTEPRPLADQRASWRLLLDLVQVSVEGSERPDVQRRRALAELQVESGGPDADRARLIDDLVGARLLSLSEEAGVTYVDLIHESLIANWERFGEAISSERRALRQRARFEQELAEWLTNDRAHDYLLAGVRLAEASDLEERHDVAMRAPGAHDLLAQSLAHAEESNRQELAQAQALADERQRASEAHRRQAEEQARSARIFRFAAAASVVLALVAVFAWTAASAAEGRAFQQLRITTSGQLAGQALSLRRSRLDLALLHSVQAMRIEDTVDARAALLEALAYSPQLTGFLHGRESRDGPNTAFEGNLAFNQDGRRLAAAVHVVDGEDGPPAIAVWDVGTGRLAGPLMRAGGFVLSLALSPDGRRLAAGGTSLRVWEVASGHPLSAPLEGQTGTFFSVAFSSDGRLLASGSSDGTIALWDLDEAGAGSGSPVLRTPLLDARPSGPVQSLAFTADGTLLSQSLDGKVRTWNITSGDSTSVEVGATFRTTGASFDRAGDLIAVRRSGDGAVVLWDVATSPPIGRTLEHETRAWGVAVSPDGQRAAGGGIDGAVTLWEAASGRLLGRFPTGSARIVRSVAFSPDGRHLAAATEGGAVALFDLTAGSELGHVISGQTHAQGSVAFSPDGRLLAAVAADGAIAVRDQVASQQLDLAATSLTGGVLGLAFQQGGRLVAVGRADDGALALWHPAIATPRRLVFDGPAPNVSGIAFSKDGEWLAVSSYSGTIYLQDVATGERRRTLKRTDTNTLYASVALSPDGSLLAAGSTSGTIDVWDASSELPIKHLSGHSRTAFRSNVSVTFSPDGRYLASTGEDNTIRRWTVAEFRDTKQPQGQPLDGPMSNVSAREFSPDGKILVTGGQNGEVALWDVATRRPIGQPLIGHTGAVQAIAFEPQGKSVVTVGADGQLLAWDVDPASWQRRACRIANRNLTTSEEESVIPSTLRPVPHVCLD